MRFFEQELKGVFLIKPNLYEDERGIFRRSFCENELSKQGITFTVKQGNISQNPKRYTMRGFHYQKRPSKETKILSCVTGSLYNVVIDLRKNSKTYMKWVALEVSATNAQSIYVPAGCANAFLTMSENTIVHYYMGDFFKESSYGGIRYNDPSFSVKWPCEPDIISEKDLNFGDFKG